MAFSGCSASIAVKISIFDWTIGFVLNRLDSTDPLKLVGTSSGDFIDHLAVFMRRIGDAADDVLCFLKSLRWHDDYVEGEAQTRKSATNPIRHFPKISPIVFEDEKVNVAVACHRAGRCRTKHNNEIGLRDLQNALHDLPR